MAKMGTKLCSSLLLNEDNIVFLLHEYNADSVNVISYSLFSKVVAENIFTNIKIIEVSSLHLPNVEHIALLNELIVKINDDTSKVFCCKSKKLLIGIFSGLARKNLTEPMSITP